MISPELINKREAKYVKAIFPLLLVILSTVILSVALIEGAIV